MKNSNIHIYIPRVELTHDEQYIRKALGYELTVERIEFIPRTNEKGHKYNGALVIVEEWNEFKTIYETRTKSGLQIRMETSSTELFLALKEGREYKFTHWPNKYWILTKHVLSVTEMTKEEATKEEATKDATKDEATKEDATKEDEEELKIINENTHIYIVRAELHHNEEYIKKAFSDIAVISQMKFVPKKNEKGQTYNGVVLLIREWINKTNGMLDTLNESKEYRHNHCSKYHWLMTRHVIDWTPPTEVVAEETKTNDV